GANWPTASSRSWTTARPTTSRRCSPCARSRPAASTRPTSRPWTRPSASARSARRWSGPPPRWSPTTTCRRATTDGSRERGTGNRGSPVPMAERLRKRGRFRVRSPAFHRSLFPVPRSRFTLDPMTPADPAASHAIPAPVPDEAVPEYGRAPGRAADYLPEEQRPLLRRAWAVGASAHAGQTRRSGEPYITHPVAVASVLAEQRVDVETLVAAILH